MTPAALSCELRQGVNPSLRYRRRIAGLTLTAMASLGFITLYQMGLIAHLPDPPLPGFDADKVHGSPKGYKRFALPDGVLGLGSYAATLALAATGGRERAVMRPWLPLAMAAKVAFDLSQAGWLLREEVVEVRALSAWSLIAVGSTAWALPPAIAEARAALSRIPAGRPAL